MIGINIGSCKIKLNFSIFVLFAFYSIFAGVTDGGLLMLSVLLHETAHLIAMIVLKQTPESINVSAMGLRIYLPKNRKLSYGQNIIISLAGPFINIIIGLIAYVFNFEAVYSINLTLGIVHLLPIEPLDGGLAFRALLSNFLIEEKCRKISFIISICILFPMAVIGFMLLLYTRNNFSLLALSIYLMLYLVLKKDMFE